MREVFVDISSLLFVSWS